MTEPSNVAEKRCVLRGKLQFLVILASSVCLRESVNIAQTGPAAYYRERRYCSAGTIAGTAVVVLYVSHLRSIVVAVTSLYYQRV